jgi:predicted RecB family nuclease
MAHENAYLAHLEARGVSVLNLRDIDDSERALARTREATESGVEAISQATLANGRWFGRADVLQRVERASKLGSWSYEVYDCKLACETKAATILQLSLYSELLESIQGILPESSGCRSHSHVPRSGDMSSLGFAPPVPRSRAAIRVSSRHMSRQVSLHSCSNPVFSRYAFSRHSLIRFTSSG